MTLQGNRVVAVIQARMDASRLPGKVLMPLGDGTLLDQVARRTRTCPLLAEVVVATTTSAKDDPIVAHCKDRGYAWFRGSEEDVLDRYYQAAGQFGADVVVRLTADNPLVDTDFVDLALGAYRAADPPCDYLASSDRFPVGLSAEVFSFAALAAAWREDTSPPGREHVTPFLYRQPGRFRIGELASPQDYSHLRCTVDTPEDLALMRRIFDHFNHDRFSWHDALSVLERHPEWAALNRHVEQKQVLGLGG